jgi:hypothetical protein
MNFTTTGTSNVFVGDAIAASLGAGANSNTGVGSEMMTNITTGYSNTGMGFNTLYAITTGIDNCCIGYASGNNMTTTSSYNTFLGFEAGSSFNVAVNSNICIGYGSGTVTNANNTLRIGNGTGTGTGNLNASYICGINGITVTGTAVLVSASDQLGISVSSQRYKENIQPLTSTPVLDLQPKRFNYTVGDDRSAQTGLIAEEVFKIMPELVVLDKQGLPQTVKYHELPVLLLLEIQKLNKRIEQLEKRG